AELPADAAVVVDLAVTDEPDILAAAGQRLGTGFRVGDGEVPRAEPGVTRTYRRGAVRAAVGHPVEHALPDLLVEGSVGCHYTRHAPTLGGGRCLGERRAHRRRAAGAKVPPQRPRHVRIVGLETDR